MRDRFVQHETFVENGYKIIIDKVAWKRQVGQRGGILDTFSEKLGF